MPPSDCSSTRLARQAGATYDLRTDSSGYPGVPTQQSCRDGLWSHAAMRPGRSRRGPLEPLPRCLGPALALLSEEPTRPRTQGASGKQLDRVRPVTWPRMPAAPEHLTATRDTPNADYSARKCGDQRDPGDRHLSAGGAAALVTPIAGRPRIRSDLRGLPLQAACARSTALRVLESTPFGLFRCWMLPRPSGLLRLGGRVVARSSSDWLAGIGRSLALGVSRLLRRCSGSGSTARPWPSTWGYRCGRQPSPSAGAFMCRLVS